MTQNEVKEYTLSDDGENPTKFFIGVLKKRDSFTLLSGVFKDDGSPDVQAIQERSGEIVKAGVKRIENYAIGKDTEPKDYDKVDDAIIESLPVTALVEIATQVITFNFLTRVEQKNS